MANHKLIVMGLQINKGPWKIKKLMSGRVKNAQLQTHSISAIASADLQSHFSAILLLLIPPPYRIENFAQNFYHFSSRFTSYRPFLSPDELAYPKRKS